MLTQISKFILLLMISVYSNNHVFAETITPKANIFLSTSNIKTDYTEKLYLDKTLIANSHTVMTEINPSEVIIDKVKDNIANNFNIDKKEIKVTKANSKTWSNGCLELAQEGEFCTQVLVEGWQIILEDEQENTWIYHTNNNGSILRLNDQI